MAPKFYHGTRANLAPCALVAPGDPPNPYAHLTPSLDAAMWASEVAEGDGPARVYIVEPTGAVEDDD